MRKSFIGSIVFVAIAFPLCPILRSQESQPAQKAPPAADQTPQAKPEAPLPTAPSSTGKDKTMKNQEPPQRVFGVLPQFGVTNQQDAPPLTSGQKFHLFARSAFDPATIVIEGLQAGLSQAENEFPGYGQGAQGYGKRFGASLADEVSSGFFSNFFYPTLLKEDPRYFRLGKGSFKHRMGYAIVQEFVCHTDSGGRSFAFENVLGAFSSGGLANVYYPSSDRGFGLTMSRSSIALGYGSLGGLVTEFWPDIHRKLFKKHDKNTPPQ